MAAPGSHTLSHVWPIHSTLGAGGELLLGGCDASELAARFGTPAYVVSEQDLRDTAREFKSAFEQHAGDNHEVHFASKAFPATAVLRVMAEAADAKTCEELVDGIIEAIKDAGMLA